MFDKSKRKENLSRTAILHEMQPNDLITLNGGDGIVHIVFPGTGTICRKSMLEIGTYSRVERTWNILGSTDFTSYKRTVTEDLHMQPCVVNFSEKGKVERQVCSPNSNNDSLSRVRRAYG